MVPADKNTRDYLPLEILGSGWSNANHFDWAFANLLELFDIAFAGCRKIAIRFAGRQIALKSFNFFINGLAFRKLLNGSGEIADDSSVRFLVSYADFQSSEIAQRVHFIEGNRGETVYADRMAHNDRIEPAAASGASGDRSEFMAGIADFVAHFVKQLRGERAFTHAGGIGFCGTDDFVDQSRADAASNADAAGDGMRACDIWISSDINIQQSSLRSFTSLPSLMAL